VLRVALGAGGIAQPGWICTDIEELNLLRPEDWESLFGSSLIDLLFAEHVWEHLSLDEARLANRNCFDFLKPSGTLRLAVPDGNNPDPSYRQAVRPGGTGPGAQDHKVLYDYKLLQQLLREAGFVTQVLEYWDEAGQFHFIDWSPEQGQVRRSRRFDPRNQNGTLAYTSLIVDAVKPGP
jgi:predicted SAM-dependent methyltransferase